MQYSNMGRWASWACVSLYTRRQSSGRTSLSLTTLGETYPPITEVQPPPIMAVTGGGQSKSPFKSQKVEKAKGKGDTPTAQPVPRMSAAGQPCGWRALGEGRAAEQITQGLPEPRQTRGGERWWAARTERGRWPEQRQHIAIGVTDRSPGGPKGQRRAKALLLPTRR